MITSLMEIIRLDLISFNIFYLNKFKFKMSDNTKVSPEGGESKKEVS